MSRKVQINKGTIQDNALKALVKSNLLPPQNRAQQKRQRQLQQTTSKKMAGRFFGIVLLCLGSLKINMEQR